MLHSERAGVVFVLFVAIAACSTVDRIGTTQLAASACWDPGFGTEECTQGEWWIEFSVNDPSVTTMKIDIAPNRTFDLTSGRVDLGNGHVKFTGGPDDGPVTQGTQIRLTVGDGSRTASTGWFAYMNVAPAVQCPDGGTPDSGTPDSGTPDSGTPDSGTPDSGQMDSGGGGGGGCNPQWSPFWQQTEYAGSYWIEFAVAGGGSLPTSVSFEIVNGSTYPLSYGYGKWTGGPGYVASGTSVILHATDATGATAKTVPFHYLVDQNPATDPCGGTSSTSQACVPLTKGMLTITMDDSYESQDTLARPVLAKYGFPATVYNITRQLSTYGDLPHAKSLANAGHEVGSHTVNHIDLTQASAQELDDELGLSRQYLLANVGSPVDAFATPMGSYNNTVLAAIRKYYASHRTVNPGLNYMGSNVYELNSDGAYGNISPATICQWIKDAATYRGWRILMFHDFTTASSSNADLLYPIADFDSILQCAQSTANLDVVTTHVGANAIRCASP